jgi:hypothetical protein
MIRIRTYVDVALALFVVLVDDPTVKNVFGSGVDVGVVVDAAGEQQ